MALDRGLGEAPGQPASPTSGVRSPPPPGEGLSSQHLGSDPQASLSPHPRLVWPLGGAGISEVPADTYPGSPGPSVRFQGQLWGSLGADDLGAA